ncbi:Uncharacterised protein [Klebsiella pneumoniae]|nr:Uncharacterised protein [Klebsiella pneumoniae]
MLLKLAAFDSETIIFRPVRALIMICKNDPLSSREI